MTARRTGGSLSRRDVVAGGVAGAVSMQLPSARATGASRFEILGSDLHWGGRPVRLKGVAVGDPFYVRKDRDGSASDFATIHGVWRANVVRLSLHPTHWRHDGKAAMERLGRDIAAARAASLFVILDWHAIGFPDRYTERPDPAWGLAPDAYDPDLDLALSFWAEAARSFGHDRGVIFELWNEPVVDPKLWVDGGQHWPLLKATWARLIDVIRRHSDAMLLASGERWAHDLTGVKHDRIDDHRLAYAWHCYPQESPGLAAWRLGVRDRRIGHDQPDRGHRVGLLPDLQPWPSRNGGGFRRAVHPRRSRPARPALDSLVLEPRRSPGHAGTRLEHAERIRPSRRRLSAASGPAARHE